MTEEKLLLSDPSKKNLFRPGSAFFVSINLDTKKLDSEKTLAIEDT